MAEFKCPLCKHRGSSNPYPEFPKVTEQNSKVAEEQYKEAKKKEILDKKLEGNSKFV